MKRTLLLALSFAFVLSACSKADDRSILQNDPQEAIYGGQESSPKSLIAQTTVLILNKRSSDMANCTGSVLSPTVILTASHCVSEEDESSKTFKVSPAANIAIYDPTEISKMHSSWQEKLSLSLIAVGKQVIAHSIYLKQFSDPSYALTATGYDIALIKLDRPLPGTFKPVVLSNDFSTLLKNQIRVAGFGSYSNDPKNDVFGYKLREGRVKIDLSANDIKAENLARKGTEISLSTANTPLSAKLAFKKNPSDASFCHGDSGGPLYFEKNGEIHLVGVNVAITSLDKCVDENRSYQLSVSLTGPQIHFVLDAYKELTGKSLASSKGSAIHDRRTFEYQLNTTTVKPKNKIANLTGYTWSLDDEGQVLLVDEDLARATCQRGGDSGHSPDLHIDIKNSSSEILDGKTAINILHLKNDIPEHVFEARMKKTGNKIRMVILTSEGYISADLHLLKCW